MEFKTIGIVGRVGNKKVEESIRQLTGFLISLKLRVIVEKRIASVMPEHRFLIETREEIGDHCDLVLVVGGDGSMLSAARTLCQYDVPLLGINRGQLGFLTDVLPEQLEPMLKKVFAGDYTLENRFLLTTVIKREGKEISRADALNDIVLNSGDTARMIEFEMYIEDQFVYSQRSDGIIISTPTGSTAYSLSGGGPIMHPKLDAIVLVPMFPHTLSGRPIVVEGNSRIKIVIGEKSHSSPHIACDGHSILQANQGDELHIHKKAEALTLLHPLEHNFYEICRDKLGWGNRLGE